MQENNPNEDPLTTDVLEENPDLENPELENEDGLQQLLEWAIGGFIGLCVVGLVLAVVSPQPRIGKRGMTPSLRNLKQISNAMHKYEAANMHFPPAYIADENGKPMHSWRVLILPFLEREDLFERYSFDEPWDGPNNSKLHSEIVEVYRSPKDLDNPVNGSSYAVVAGQGTGFEGDHETKLVEVSDGMSNTLLLVEVRNPATHWMEPVDITLEAALVRFSDAPKAEASFDQVNEINVTLMDASTHTIECPVSAENLKALATIDGGEIVDITDL